VSDGDDALMKIAVKFRDDYFFPQVRRKYFTMIDWFSFIGGILGLFFGFSFLSAFEIIFHVLKGVFDGKSVINFKVTKRFTKVIEYCQQFLINSSIHSFKYIADKNYKLSEK